MTRRRVRRRDHPACRAPGGGSGGGRPGRPWPQPPAGGSALILLPGLNRLASVRTVTEIEREVLAVRAEVLDEVHRSEDSAGRRADDELVGAGEDDRLVG